MVKSLAHTIKRLWHSVVHHTRKNSHLLYYIANGLRYAVPRNILHGRGKRILATYDSLSPEEKKYVDDRVDYYCKFAESILLPRNAKTLQDFTVKKRSSYVNDYINSTYFFDAYEFVRFFPKHFRWAYNPGDVNYLFPVPEITKSRPIAADDSNRNNILLNLDKIRHFTWVQDPFKWEEKACRILFRGDTTNKPHRLRFIEMWQNHPMCDIASGGAMSLYDHLSYRYIMSLEGNDVASNLKWVMSSNSVAVMPRPKFETWYMEGKLVPNYHYIEIADDYHDLIDRIMYYEQHPEEVKEIVQHAHEWARQFRNNERERLISMRVLQKYFTLTGQLNSDSWHTARNAQHYYVNDYVKITASQKINAQGKARADVAHTLKILGYRTVDIVNFRYSCKEDSKYHHYPVLTPFLAKWHVKRFARQLKAGDVVFMQDAHLSHMKQLASVCQQRKVKVVILLHDLQSVRYGISTDEVNMLNQSSVTLVHTDAMKAKLLEMGVKSPMQVITFFDYYSDDPMLPMSEVVKHKNEVVFAGNLQKSEFLPKLYSYEGNRSVRFKLYGMRGDMDFSAKKNFEYCGIFKPNKTGAIHGGWGLVWDGDSIESCTGNYGDYLRYNSSHKNSLYLACGMPLIVWEGAALAEVVKQEGIGITVASLYDLDKRLEAITEDEYTSMINNTRRIGERLRKGLYLTEALS